MKTSVGINGFGRIGRQVTRAILERYPDDIEIALINDSSDPEVNAHLFKYDSTYGRYPGTVHADEDGMVIDGHRVAVSNQTDPSRVPWGENGVDIVIEATGGFTSASKAALHMEAGAKKVIVSAPCTDADSTIIMGVNDHQYDPDRHRVISCSSCTTNCVVPVVKVLNDAFKVRSGLMTTVHAYTNDQSLIDGDHTDLRRARSAAENIIPTSTGAAKSIGQIIPELDGRVHGIAVRVPTPTVSLVDFTAQLGCGVTPQRINDAMREAASNGMRNVLSYTEDPVVSSDIKRDPHSSVFDGLSTMVVNKRSVKVLAWYDNEWGYSCRLADLTHMVAEMGV